MEEDTGPALFTVPVPDPTALGTCLAPEGQEGVVSQGAQTLTDSLPLPGSSPFLLGPEHCGGTGCWVQPFDIVVYKVHSGDQNRIKKVNILQFCVWPVFIAALSCRLDGSERLTIQTLDQVIYV